MPQPLPQVYFAQQILHLFIDIFFMATQVCALVPVWLSDTPFVVLPQRIRVITSGHHPVSPSPQAKTEPAANWEQKDQLRQQQVDAADDTPLAKAVRSTQACILTPLCFFVSWQGVLTVAYGCVALAPFLQWLTPSTSW